jgi:hypothetical protein
VPAEVFEPVFSHENKAVGVKVALCGECAFRLRLQSGNRLVGFCILGRSLLL